MVRRGSILLLALALCLKALVGPAALAAPLAPGLVAICAGGQIIYVALEGFDLPGAAEAPAPGRADPCPAFAFAAAPPPLAPAVVPIAFPRPVAALLPHRPATVVGTALRAHPPRAPPQVSAAA